jgi:hypothetical protein
MNGGKKKAPIEGLFRAGLRRIKVNLFLGKHYFIGPTLHLEISNNFIA